MTNFRWTINTYQSSAFVLFLFLFLFLLKFLWIVIFGRFTTDARCPASLVHIYRWLTTRWRHGRCNRLSSSKRISAFTFLCSHCNSKCAFCAIFHNCPCFNHCCVNIGYDIYDIFLHLYSQNTDIFTWLTYIIRTNRFYFALCKIATEFQTILFTSISNKPPLLANHIDKQVMYTQISVKYNINKYCWSGVCRHLRNSAALQPTWRT